MARESAKPERHGRPAGSRAHFLQLVPQASLGYVHLAGNATGKREARPSHRPEACRAHFHAATAAGVPSVGRAAGAGNAIPSGYSP